MEELTQPLPEGQEGTWIETDENGITKKCRWEKDLRGRYKKVCIVAQG